MQAANLNIQDSNTMFQSGSSIRMETGNTHIAQQTNSSSDAFENARSSNEDPGQTMLMASNWEVQDEELWSVAMGYDLLEPSLLGLSNYDFVPSGW